VKTEEQEKREQRRRRRAEAEGEKTRLQSREEQRGLKGEKKRNGKIRTIPGRCREGGSTAGRSERREHSSRREREREERARMGAAEERLRERERERKCSGRGLGFPSGQHSRVFFFKDFQVTRS